MSHSDTILVGQKKILVGHHQNKGYQALYVYVQSITRQEIEQLGISFVSSSLLLPVKVAKKSYPSSCSREKSPPPSP